MLHTLTSLQTYQKHKAHKPKHIVPIMLLPELGFIQNGSLFKEKAVFSHRIK
jgi:hypothetical protein